MTTTAPTVRAFVAGQWMTVLCALECAQHHDPHLPGCVRTMRCIVDNHGGQAFIATVDMTNVRITYYS